MFRAPGHKSACAVGFQADRCSRAPLSRYVLLLLAGVSVAACGETDRGGGRILVRCVPGQSDPCTCSDGRAGAQLCLDDRTYGTCTCDGPLPDASAPDLGSSAGDAGATAEDAEARDGAPPAEDDDAGVEADAAESLDVPAAPDASPGFPDASPGFPDASPGFPDASPGLPDAAPRDVGPRDAGGGCNSDTECAPPLTICEGHACVPGCNEPGGTPCSTGSCSIFTGRCGGQLCLFDGMCSPPSTICESQTCVPGCLVAGCPGGQVCNSTDGRCATSCATDSQCTPPDTVCEQGACLPGCGAFGGATCPDPFVCSETTGRCGPCSTDAQCGPPASICSSGQCVPGCAEPGGAACSGGTVCQHGSGRCEPPGAGLLGAVCTDHADCASSYCRPFAGSTARWCTTACGTNRECPSGYSCVEDSGAHLCAAAARVSGATFSTPSGGSCASNAECQSNHCAGSVCVDTCAEDSDCTSGSCRWYSPVMNDRARACNGPLGNVANGGACANDGDCRSGVCAGGTCAELCSTTSDCDPARTCAAVDDSVCTTELFPGFCLVWEINFVTACVVTTRGAGAVGAPCAAASDCQSAICHLTLSRCTDTCARNADCPATDRCKSVEYATLDLQPVDLDVCVPQGF